TVDDVTPANDSWADAFSDSNGTRPHDDPRQLLFVGNNAIETNDGGVYRLFDPNTSATRRWESMNGNIRPTEFYSVAYDEINNTIFGGSQDNGSSNQRATTDPSFPFTWDQVQGADGGVAAVDNTSMPGFSIHYTTSQNLGLVRHTVDANNSESTHDVDLA